MFFLQFFWAFLFLFVPISSLGAQVVSEKFFPPSSDTADPPANPGGPNPETDPASSPAITPLIAPNPAVKRGGGIASEQKGVDWSSLFRESLQFLSIEHAFRSATEYDTRNAKGAFFQQYANSVGNLHGWADGDEFYVNYVGHPMQGSTAGYLWAQNDRQYRSVEFGKDPRYWKGRFRSAAFTWAYSTQFEIGAISEASIGYIQASFPQQGFVDQVVTPVLGTAWMIGEDSVDKYVIKWFEAKTRNRYARMMLRGTLNPTRSMANMMAGKAPWHRYDRLGVLAYDPTAIQAASIPVRLVVDRSARPDAAPFEFTTTSEFRNYFGNGSGIGCIGGGATALYRVSREFQLVAEVSGCKMIGMEKNLSGDSLTYMTGTRWTPSPEGRWSPHLQVLAGGNKITNEEMFPLKKAALDSAAKQKGLDPPAHEQYTRQDESNGFAIAAGGGLDLKLTSALAFQVAKVEYTRSWVRPVNGIDYSNGLRLTMGIVLRMGTW
jgi:hypothetical protein